MALWGNMIRLGPNRYARVDAADYPLVSMLRWEYKCGQARATLPDGSTVLMHHLIAAPGRNDDVFHRNNDMLNNRRSNLYTKPRIERLQKSV